MYVIYLDPRLKHTEPMKTILISGARAPIALEMARSFKQAGNRVIMMDCQLLTIARWSNCVDKYYTVPSPRFNQKEFLEALQQIISQESVSHLIPTCEEALFISAYRNILPCNVWTAEQDLMIQLHNKYEFVKRFNHLLPFPKTVLLSDLTDWSITKNSVLKPIYSRFASSVFIKKDVESTFFEEDEKHKWIAQEFIAGKEICIYSVWEHGVLKAFSAYHPLYRAGKGAGIFFEPVQNENVFNDVKKFGETINYHGQLCFDVIINQEQQHFFIECNPRGTSGAHLLHRHLAPAFLDKTFVQADTRKEFAIKYAMLLLHPFSLVKTRVRQADDTIFSWRDLKPFFLQIISLFEITYNKFSKKISWLEATTADIEWNGN